MTTTASYERPPVEVALLRGALSPELQPGGGERPLRHSEISERESATTFQTVSDMGHRDWIKSLRDGKASATLSENLWKPIKVEVSSIRSELNKACVKPARHLGSEHAFLPLGHLLRILSPKNVDGLLRQKFPGDLERFDHQVYGKNGDPKRLKIMGTLILMENLEFLRDFVQAGVEDLQLPLALEEEEERIVLFDRHGNMIESPHKWSWGYGHADFFMYKQMQVCSLFCTLKEDGAYMDHFRLPGNFILPFRNCKPPVVKYGGFGQVIKVEIEPSHLLYKGKSRKPEYFCVKTIRHDVPEHPDEADSLARRLVIRDRKDREHLHRLLFSFRRVDFYYLVFEWADGDLTELWQEMPKRYKPSDHEHVCWFLRQCVGIMRSLHGLQNHASSLAPGEGGRPVFYDACHGRHSDLKPENILWFKNYQDSKKDHLVIADLGLTQFRTTKSKSRVAWADVGGYTEAYKAPESDVKHVVGGKYDIWGIGCVFLLHASVFLRGDAGCIEEFSERRKAEANKHPRHGNCVDNAFYYLVREGEHGDISSRTSNRTQYRGEVKKEVREWISKLQADKSCSAPMRDFLRLIGEGMLVADDSSRYDTKKILSGLSNIYDELQKPKDAGSPRNTPTWHDLQSGVNNQHYRDATTRQSEALAGMAGWQENPGASIKRASEIDLESRPNDHGPHTPINTSSDLPLQQTSSVRQLILKFERLKKKEDSRK